MLALQLDPYLVAPLWPDSVSVAALQARLGIEAGLWTEKDMAEVARAAAAAARRQPGGAGVRRDVVEELLGQALRRRPAAGARLRAGRRRGGGGDPGVGRAGARTVRAAGLDHLVRAPDRVGLAGRTGPAGAQPPLGPPRGAAVDVAELHAPFTHQEILLRQALGLAASRGETRSTRRAARSAATRCSRRAWPGSAARPRRSCTGRAGTGARARHQRPGPAAEPGVRDEAWRRRDQ